MSEIIDIAKTKVNVGSEYGHLNAVLLHRPGVEIERMTPATANDALYSDILCKHIGNRIMGYAYLLNNVLTNSADD